jgi:hypothetical protein
MIRKGLTGLFAGVCLALAAGCTDAVSEESFTQITPGMTRSQVEGILGAGEKEDRSGVSISGAGIAGGSAAGSSTTTYSWKSGQKQIIVEFKDDKVVHARKLNF